MRKILIIEDEPEIRLILSMALQHSGSFEPILAADGLEGLATAKIELPDLILVDIMMPRLDGYATCKQLKGCPELKDIPVIFLTAKTDQHEVDKALKLGACGYLRKPFDPLRLAGQIEAILTGVANNANG